MRLVEDRVGDVPAGAQQPAGESAIRVRDGGLLEHLAEVAPDRVLVLDGVGGALRLRW